MVPEPEKEAGKDGEKDAEKDSSSETKEVAHPASAAIIDAAFTVEKKGGAAVARSEEEAAAYLVRLDDIIHPDPGGFAARKESIEKDLLRSKQDAHLTAWRSEVFAEARGRSAPDDEAPVAAGSEPSPGAGAGQ
jgi:hypothetical protein